MNKITAFFIVAIMLLGGLVSLSGNAVEANIAEVNTKQNNELASLLPASDAVVTMNAQRFLSDALPQFLPLNSDEINQKINEVKSKTGIDVRSFEQVAVGMKFEKVGNLNKMEVKPIVLTRGTFNAAGLISLVKIAANGKYRQENINGKTVYTIKMEDLAKQVSTKSAKIAKDIGKAQKIVSTNFAIVAVDQNTLAIGEPTIVRDMLRNRTRIDANLLGLVNRNPNGILNFAGNVPPSATQLLKMDNDEIGKLLNSIRQVFGSIDINDDDASVSLSSITEQAEQAEQLESTLQGLQALGVGILESKKDLRSQIAFRALQSLQIKRATNEVNLQTSLSKVDINGLINNPKPAPTPSDSE
ncbi:MAG: hypothetical protein H7Z37_02480 [Pyrinomonadaceae bacterium]|nr:hypothetical protein [Pyrinomonadaceae bacterium]